MKTTFSRESIVSTAQALERAGEISQADLQAINQAVPNNGEIGAQDLAGRIVDLGRMQREQALTLVAKVGHALDAAGRSGSANEAAATSFRALGATPLDEQKLIASLDRLIPESILVQMYDHRDKGAPKSAPIRDLRTPARIAYHQEHGPGTPRDDRTDVEYFIATASLADLARLEQLAALPEFQQMQALSTKANRVLNFIEYGTREQNLADPSLTITDAFKDRLLDVMQRIVKNDFAIEEAQRHVQPTDELIANRVRLHQEVDAMVRVQQDASPDSIAHLDAATLKETVHKKGTCPFIGTALATGALPVRNNAEKPLAGIEDVVRLGNLGGGDLGEVLRVFAEGNHGVVPGLPGQLDLPVSAGLFSLDFPASQGSHPGHSGILQGDPALRDTGRFSDADWQRLLARAENGQIKRSEIGKFIAENLMRDPDSKVFGTNNVIRLLGADLLGFVGSIGPHLFERLTNSIHGRDESDDERRLFTNLTKALGEDNLVGSAGEFALLLEFLANKPGAARIDGEPAVSVADLTAMFRDKKFPEGWENWPKTKHGWMANTTALILAAGKEYLRLKRDEKD